MTGAGDLGASFFLFRAMGDAGAPLPLPAEPEPRRRLCGDPGELFLFLLREKAAGKLRG